MRFVEKTAESDTLERGIDAVPESDAIYLEWYSNHEENLAGYVISRSIFEDRNFVEIARIKKITEFELPDTTFIDQVDSLNILDRYYYYIEAIDDFDQLGEPSDVVSYKLVPKPILGSPRNVITQTSPDFTWDFDESFVPNAFVFRLLKRNNQKYFYYFTKLSLLRDDYAPHQQWTGDELTLPTPLPSGTYRWRIDPIGAEENQGAESIWLDFTIQ
ncbi:hypothetical protein B1H10_06460 [candidate division KSB1 bacterium 4484_188]|nr:MAG: hypothetical protein B1H10_06460 [candidate division KSB1 bacterium 4484_188]